MFTPVFTSVTVRFTAAVGCLVALVLLVAPAPARAIDVATIKSPDGLTAWLVQDNANPMVTIHFAFEGGAALDPEGKAGLAYMVSGLLDEGAGDLDSQAFQRELAGRAIELSFDAGRDSFSGTLKTLTENLDEALGLLRLALSEPRFDTDAVERIRGQVLAGLRYEQNDPQTIARRAWFAAVFQDHPYRNAVEGTPETVAAITVEDLKTFARKHLTRDRLMIGIAGDLAPDQVAALLDRTFRDLPATSDLPAVADATPHADGRTLVLEQDVPQSVALFGHAGLARSDPDWYAAYVINYILGGGGFSSRLVEEVRETRGLAYTVYSYLMPYDHAPVWLGGVGTSNARMGESLDLIRATWARMAAEGPTEQELTDAKTYLTGAWPLRFTSTGAIAGILVAMQKEGLPPSYLDDRNAYIAAVTLEDARRVAARLMDADALTTVVVGRPEGVETSTN